MTTRRRFLLNASHDERVEQAQQSGSAATPAQDAQRTNTINRFYSAVIMFVVVQFIFLAGLVYLRVSQMALEDQISSLHSETLTNREAGYKNRAAACKVLVIVGDLNPSDFCQEPAITKYYDPSDAQRLVTSEDALKNRATSCLAIHASGVLLPDLCLDPAVTKYYSPTTTPPTTAPTTLDTTLDTTPATPTVQPAPAAPDPSPAPEH